MEGNEGNGRRLALVCFATAAALVTTLVVAGSGHFTANVFAQQYDDPSCSEYGNPVAAEYPEECPDAPPQLFAEESVTVVASGPTGATVTFQVFAWDAEDGPLTPDCSPASGSLFPIGSTLVECVATDSASQSVSRSLLVIVLESTACTVGPSGVQTGLTNMGFESGDLSGWRTGLVTDTVAATGADAFVSPYEGSWMARLGSTAPSSDGSQPRGPNELCQDFVVDAPQESFVYNVFTYDYTGFDEFRFVVTVVDPATGEVLAFQQQGAWGVGTNLKTSGWKYVALDLAGHIGKTVRILVSAGGTADTLFAFWAYLDSAESGPPPVVAPLGQATAATGSVMTDPQTGQVTVAMPVGAKSDITITSPIACPGGASPTAAILLLNGTQFPMSQGSSGTWSATIPAAEVASGNLTISATCPSSTFTNTVGTIQLYDPSGIVTDAATGQPIQGASVTLYKVPGWTAMANAGDTGATKCQSNASKAPGDPWSQPAPTSLGVAVNPNANPEIEPDVNPFITDANGRYGWDVAAGCWYIVVSKAGYHTLTSPVVGVPPEVTDLHVALTPVASTGSSSGGGGGSAPAGGAPPKTTPTQPTKPATPATPNAAPRLALAGGSFRPPLRASRGKAVARVRAGFSIDEAAVIAIDVRDVRTGKRIPVRRGSRIAGALVGRDKQVLRWGTAGARSAALDLRLRASQVRRGRLYRIVVRATDPQGASSLLVIPFRG